MKIYKKILLMAAFSLCVPFVALAGSSSSIITVSVTGISGSTILASRLGGTYTINTNSQTKIKNKANKKISFSRISVGDKLKVKGDFGFIIGPGSARGGNGTAKTIKDLSVKKTKK